MSQETSNLYQAPEANLTQPGSGNKPILAFDRFSAWWVFLLSLFTFGIYPIYWLLNRSSTANGLAKYQINMAFPIGYVIAIIVSAVVSYSAPESTLEGIISIITLIVWLVAIYSLRTSITELINEGSAEPVTIGPILTFFFSLIYLQYKINEAIDNQQQ